MVFDFLPLRACLALLHVTLVLRSRACLALALRARLSASLALCRSAPASLCLRSPSGSPGLFAQPSLRSLCGVFRTLKTAQVNGPLPFALPALRFASHLQRTSDLRASRFALRASSPRLPAPLFRASSPLLALFRL